MAEGKLKSLFTSIDLSGRGLELLHGQPGKISPCHGNRSTAKARVQIPAAAPKTSFVIFVSKNTVASKICQTGRVFACLAGSNNIANISQLLFN
jgi:hypothetical protein